MSVRCLKNKKEWTKDGRKWIYDVYYKDKRTTSRKFATKAEALEAEIEYKNKLKDFRDTSKMTLDDLCNAHYKYKTEIDPSKYTTQYNYIEKRKHLDSIKHIKLDDLKIENIDSWKEELNNKGLSTRTKNDILKYLKSVLNYGSDILDFDFRSLYKKIKNFKDPNALPKEMEFYTWEEFKKFISVEDNIKYRALFETLFFCGLRIGELKGLTWKNVDLEKRIIHIRQNCVNVKGDEGHYLITTPKTKSSIRDVPIVDRLYKDLKEMKKQCKDIIDFNDEFFVFGGVRPIHSFTINQRKARNAELAHVKKIRNHDFRHSCASLIINANYPVVDVARYLGHAKVDETLNTYAHMYPSDVEGIKKMMNKLN